MSCESEKVPKISRARSISQVLQISAREGCVRNDFDLAFTLLRDLNNIAEVPYTAVDLNLVLKEFLESGDIKDLVAGGLRSIDDELWVILARYFPFHQLKGWWDVPSSSPWLASPWGRISTL